MVSSPRHLHAVEGSEGDNVARWEALLSKYPQAAVAFNNGWYFGALRDFDDVLRANNLGVLIDRLMTREQHPETPAG